MPSLPLMSDIEGGATVGDFQYFIASLSKQSEDKIEPCQLIRLNQGVYQECVSVRDDILAHLNEQFEAQWLALIKQLPPKQGGLNVEALAQHYDNKSLVIGLSAMA